MLLLLLLTRRLAWRLVQKLQGHVKHKKDDMFGRQRKKQEGQQRHQYEVANKYVLCITLYLLIIRTFLISSNLVRVSFVSFARGHAVPGAFSLPEGSSSSGNCFR